MGDLEQFGHWLMNGRQKQSVAKVIRKPMTPTEIHRASHTLNPHIQLRDIWSILRQLEKRGLVYCLNSHRLPGDVYFFTEWGRHVAATSLGIHLNRELNGVNWRLYGRVACAPARRAVLQELWRSEKQGIPEITVSLIRKGLRDRRPMALNQVVRAIKELESYGLVKCFGFTKKGNRRKYQVTKPGTLVIEELLR
jgi:Fe2+ or Zn2+ uptake regulation protein